MDTKAPSSLDPKLKEVYDRVMGTANPKASPPAQTTPQPAMTPATPPPANGGLSASPFPGQVKTPAPEVSAPKFDAPKVTQSVPTPQPPAGGMPAAPQPAATSPMGKPVVDYAALAAKYATPTPPVNAMASTHVPAVPAAATPTFGVVNSAADQTKTDNKEEKAEKSEGGSKKKLLLIIGLPIMLVVYTVAWILIFHIDMTAFLPK